MSRLLVVLTHGARLEGVVADAQRDEDGARVFYRDGVEVARAGAGQAVVVRDTGARRSFRTAVAPPSLAGAR